MRNTRWVEITVGVFIILVVLALIVLAFRVSGSKFTSSSHMYEVTADFDNIGGLKKRATVNVSGVAIGYVDSITLDAKSFRAVVHMEIEDGYQIPVDSSANIYTQGLLGSNYIAIVPGFEMQNVKPGGVIETTHSALVLENLVGQLIYNLKGDKGDKDDKNDKADQPEKEAIQ
jgi:phospholipid/cholesterol/gamma-HCH transport system substrate-binding protein